MAEPFKNLLNAAVVADIGRHLERAWAGFDRPRFEALALQGLGALEMKARAHHLCNALEPTLPADFSAAADVMQQALAAADDTLEGPMGARPDGLAGWAVWPLTEYVARHGHADTPRALAALHAMTQRFTAEWAVRPFLLRDPKTSFAALQGWVNDPSPQVRRWVSEGSRPRLPWGLVLKPLVDDPSPTLPLLEVLMNDDSAYVRRSVANHLNDIAKDHPQLVEAWVRRHLPGASAEQLALLRHASRTLIKQGHGGVMGAFGVGDAFVGQVDVEVLPGHAVVGDTVALRVRVRSASKAPQRLVIDYAVHHVKANGGTSPKVFKGWGFELAVGETRELLKRHSLRPITTRRYFAGVHRVEVMVNGRVEGVGRFELSDGSV